MNLNTINLNQNWKLTYENISWDIGMAPAVLAKEEGRMDCSVPSERD